MTMVPAAIPLVNLRAQNRALQDELAPVVQQVLGSGAYILGQAGGELERAIARRLDVPHALGLASGTDALYLALLAADIGPGDEVITTPFTFVATVETILRTGARPVFADIDPLTFNLATDGLEALVTDRTRAILPVHLFGRPADMTAIMALAAARGLAVIEDCAQSFGAVVDGRATGTIGTIGCYSFYPTKVLGGCGDGGMVVTHSDALADRIRALRNHGIEADGSYAHIGFNSRLDEMQAAILQVKLGYLDDYIARRRQVAQWYGELLADSAIVTPRLTAGHVFNVYTVLVDERDRLVQRLRRGNIGCTVYYPAPIHRLPFWPSELAVGPLPQCEAVCRRCVSLPIYPELSRDQVQRVAHELLEHLHEIGG